MEAASGTRLQRARGRSRFFDSHGRTSQNCALTPAHLEEDDHLRRILHAECPADVADDFRPEKSWPGQRHRPTRPLLLHLGRTAIERHGVGVINGTGEAHVGQRVYAARDLSLPG